VPLLPEAEPASLAKCLTATLEGRPAGPLLLLGAGETAARAVSVALWLTAVGVLDNVAPCSSQL